MVPHPQRAGATRLRPRRLRHLIAGFALAGPLLWAATPAVAELPDTATLLADLGLSSDEIGQIGAGQLVHHAIPPASDRELTTGLAFQVPVPPAELVKDARRDLLDRVDPDMIGFGVISTPATLADFSKLTLTPEQAKAYQEAAAGGDLNLSSEEIATFQKLGSDAPPEAVAQAVRAALLARVQAYRTKGLPGIAPYALGGGKQRSPAEEIATATKATRSLAKYAPEAHQLLVSYPGAKPPGTEEIFRWSHFQAHGVPTLALSHLLLIPDGDAWILAKRQFYVSTGYNSEEAVAAFLPTQGGSVMVYATRTSTDQVTGFGGGAKRSIGSKLLTSQLESMFEKARGEVR